MRKRVGKCILFGLNAAQVQEAGSILQEVVTGWRELVAGSEGFLTGKGRAGLEGHRVVWGEMVCFDSFSSASYPDGNRTRINPAASHYLIEGIRKREADSVL